MRKMKHLRKEEHHYGQRALAALCALTLLLWMIPTEVFTAWAAAPADVELTASDSAVEFGTTDTTQTVTLSLAGENAGNYTVSGYSVQVDDDMPVSASVDESGVVTLTRVAGKYGTCTVTATASLKEDTAEPSESQTPAEPDPENPTDEPQGGTDPVTPGGETDTDPVNTPAEQAAADTPAVIDEEGAVTPPAATTPEPISVSTEITITVNYALDFKVELTAENPSDSLEVGKPVYATITEKNGAEYEGYVTYAYKWYQDTTLIESATDRSYTPTAVGNYRVEVTFSKLEEAELPEHLTLSAAPNNVVESDMSPVGQGTPNIEEVSIEFPAMTYGDDATTTQIKLHPIGLAGTYTFGTKQVEMTANEAKTVTADEIGLDMNAGEDKKLDYIFTPDDSTNYKSKAGWFTYTVKPYELTLRVTVPGKHYDGTTTIQYYDEANQKNADVTIADSSLETAQTSPQKITYGFVPGMETSRLVGEDTTKTEWNISNLNTQHFAYSSAGDVAESKSVDVVYAAPDSDLPLKLQIQFISHDEGTNSTTYTLSENYTVTLQCAPAAIEKNTFADAYTLAPDYLDSTSSTNWFKGEKIKLKAETDYTLSAEETGAYTTELEIAPTIGETPCFYAKKNGLVAKVSVTEKFALDETAPAVSVSSVTTAGGGQPTTSGTVDYSKEELTYTIAVSEEDGSGVKTVSYAVTKGAVAPAESAASWQTATLVDGKFTVTASGSGYVWVKAEDQVGNKLEATKIRALVIETNKPTVSITPNVDETTYAKSYDLTVLADDVSDGETSHADGEYSGIQSITYTVKDSEGKTVSGNTESYAPASDPTQIQPNETLSLAVPAGTTLLDGTYQLAVTAKDFCGNTASTVEKTLLLDNTPPTVTVAMAQTEQKNTYYYRADNCGITVTVKDAHTAVKEVTVVVSNGATEVRKELKDSTVSDDGTVTVSFTAAEIAALDTNGNTTLTLTVSAKDTLGNAVTDLASATVTGLTVKEDNSGATFVLDTHAPSLTAIACAQTGKGPYQDGDIQNFYYNDAAMVLNFTVEEENFASLTLGYKKDGTSVTPIALNDKSRLSATLSAEGAYSEITLTGEDLAGNKLVLGYTPATGTAEQVTCSNGTVSFVYGRVIDRTAPTATVVYTSTASGQTDPDGTNDLYYNADVAVKLSVSDNHDLGGTSWNFVKSTDGTESAIALTGTEHTETLSSDGEYHYAMGMTGNTDRAGNAVVALTHSDSVLGALTDPTVVIDTVAPLVKFAISTSATNTKLYSEYNNRYFFNAQFTATYTVTDKNLSAKKVDALVGVSSGENYENASVTPNTAMTAEGDSFTYTSSGDGAYFFSINGTDKAGNPITLDGSPSTSISSNPLSSSAAPFTSYGVVVDTTAPTMEVKIGDYYAAELTGDGYHVTSNSPYRKEQEAVFSYSSSDLSPTSVEYTLYSSVESTAITGGGSYSNNDSGTYTFQGEQIFAIESLAVTDLAGNRTEASQSVDGRVSNLIYLDATAPTDDQLSPTVKLVAHESGQGRSTAGVDLYDKTVTIDAIVSEPGYTDQATGGKSSGLYTVYYEVLQNNSSNWTSVLTGTVKSSGKNSTDGIVRYASGSAYTDVQNEKLTGKDTLTFTFDAEKFNFNDISLRVWAEDNSGNVLSKENGAVYRFGIDTSAPSITVSYDNNDVQNEKYFKADRTATVVVHERNFDPSRTVITSQVGSSGTWAYSRGSSANGDDDTWTTTVSYTTDGDYTFDVTTADLLGHTSSGVDYGNSVAPKAFTVDKTVPVISVSFDNDSVKNGKYYNAARTATVLIQEHNFNASAANVTVSASIQEGNVVTPSAGGWGSSGDANTAAVAFTEDGNYSMQIQFTDLAGNPATMVTVDEFVIDTTPPELSITGVKDRVAYGDVSVIPSIEYHDVNCDSSSIGLSITGYKHTQGESLTGTRVDSLYGGSFVCDSIAKVRSADDVYTATGTVSDLAGNSSSAEVRFSVNRFGSNYILSETSKTLVGDETTEGSYYTNQAPTLEVTEINVNALVTHSVSASCNGSVTEMVESKDYEINTVQDGWSETTYRIYSENFEEEGAYIVTLTSEDEAENLNTNRSVKGDNGINSSVDLDFHVDKTAPMCFFSGVTGDDRYTESERDISVNFSDNTKVAQLILTVSTDDGVTEQIAAELTEEELNSLDGVYHYVATAANDWQVLRVTAVDAAGNSNEHDLQGNALEPVSVRYLLTTSLLVQYVNNVPALLATGGVLVGGIGFSVLVIRRRRLRVRRKH